MFFDQQGRLTDLVAQRYRTPDASDPDTWSTPFTGYGEFEGLRLPATGKAIYKLPGGDLEYINVTLTELHYDTAPASTRREPMKVLICAASKYGATSEIARAVADVLAGRGCEVTVLPPQEAGAVEEFDAVVLGSAVYMGQWMKPARELAERSAAALASRPVWLFSSGPVGEPAKLS